MSTKAGSLLWRRMRLTLASGVTDVDTGLTQLNKSFAADSPNEPPLGVGGTTSPPDGTLPASRIQVLPEPPVDLWNDISHGEPYFNTTTHTIHVSFTNANKSPLTINAFFWDPHTMVGPGEADTYNAGR